MSVRPPRERRASSIGLTLGLLLGACAGARAQTPVAAARLGGVPHQAVFEAGKTTVLVATSRGVVRINADGSLTPVFRDETPPASVAGAVGGAEPSTRPEPIARRGPFVLAPDGGFVVDARVDGRRVDGAGIVRWRVPRRGFPNLKKTVQVDLEGVREIAVGSGGRILIGSRPLDRRDPVGGKWEVSVFDGSGDKRTSVTTLRQPRIALAPDGSAAAVVERDGVLVLRANGSSQRKIAGRFADVALSAGANVLVARRPDRAQELAVVGFDGCQAITAPRPIHGARISTKGKAVLLWQGDGRIHVAALAACALPSTPLPLPKALAGRDVFVASADLQDDGLVTAGLLARSTPEGRFDQGWVVQWRDGAVARAHRLDLGLASATVPDVVVGRRGRVVARTYESVAILPELQ